MNTLKSLQLVGALALASLIHFSPAAAQDPKEGEIGPGNDGGIPGATIDPKFMEVSSQHVAAMSRRLEDAEALDDLEDSVDEILRVIQDLLDERRSWVNQRQRIANALEGVRRDISDLNDAIDDIETAIAISMAASAGIPNPELVVTRETLVARKNRLKGERERLKNALGVADQKIAQLQGMINDANARLAEKQEEKRQLQEHIAEVSLVAPSPGARLLVDSDEELRLRSDQPPKQVVIEVQEFVTRGGSSPEDPIRQSWETVYNRNLEWENLASAGPGVVSLAFKTGTRPQGHSIPIIGLEAFWLERGEYRARVARVGATGHGSASGGDQPLRSAGAESENEDSSISTWVDDAESSEKSDVDSMRRPGGGSGSGEPIEWRRFTVVGKVDSEVLGKRAPVPQRVKPGAVFRPAEPKDDEDDEDDEHDGG